ncbi:hypothetical protein, partial [Streptomyces sp. NPDC057115]|uniref:hypothetical protein n=1 Tax=Streptomyces sp. NPDC057115 TaxID=3346022 RepID=UPI00363EBD17
MLREPGAGKLLNQLPQPTTRQTSTDPMRQHPTRPPQPHEQQSFRKSNPAPPPLPAEGRVRVGGTDLAELDRADWHSRIAWVPQR